jgi:hypothetical protein
MSRAWSATIFFSRWFSKDVEKLYANPPFTDRVALPR